MSTFFGRYCFLLPFLLAFIGTLMLYKKWTDNSQENCQVAIKEVVLRGVSHESLQRGQDPLDARETGALLRVLDIKDEDPECVKHIIDVKAIFDQGWKRYYMFPWADGGHLWDLWERHRVIESQGERKFVADIVAQVLGLAEAIAVLHQDNYRHGDLKPENILIFTGQNQPDMWKIADLGLAKFHIDPTQRRQGPTSTRHGTFSYEPPEYLDEHQPRSRLYDIWSMGCIILQLITWMLYDIQGVIELTERTRNRYQSGSTFWRQRSRLGIWSVQTVHEEVKSHMRQIMRDATGSQAIMDLLGVVKDKLLVVQLPTNINNQWRPGYRANAQTLHDELAKIAQRGEFDPSYWSTDETLFYEPANATSSAAGSLGGGYNDVSSFSLVISSKPKHPKVEVSASLHTSLTLSVVLAAPSETNKRSCIPGACNTMEEDSIHPSIPGDYSSQV